MQQSFTNTLAMVFVLAAAMAGGCSWLHVSDEATMGGTRCKDGFLDWPMPMPTSQFRLKAAWLSQTPAVSLADVARRVEAELTSIKGKRHPIPYGWFRLPGQSGFAVVSQIEALNEKGDVVPDPLLHPPPFLSVAYLKALVQGQYTHYRSFVLVVSDHEIRREEADTTDDRPMTLAQCGSMNPPKELGQFLYSQDHKGYLFIYELARGNRGPFEYVRPEAAAWTHDEHKNALGMADMVE